MKLAYVYGTEETIAPVLGVKGNAQKIFPWLKENGYGGIEPFVRNPKLFNTIAFEKIVNHFDMEVAAVGTGPVVSDDKLTFTDSDNEIRKEAVKRVKDIVDFASCFNAPVNIGKLRGNIDLNQEQSWEWMRDCFTEVCEYAYKYGINIVIEPQNKNNINNINSTTEALKFIEEVNLPNLYLMLDTYHMSYEDTAISEGLIKSKDKLKHIHIADSNRLVPGQGEIDFTDIMKALHSINYTNYLAMEVKCQSDWFLEAKGAYSYFTQL